MPFSQLSLYYDADNNLRVIQNYTNSDNTADLSTTLVTQPVIPLGGHAPKFEMRVVPSNNTYITQNDYANWRGLDVGVGYVKQRLEVADDAPPGTISASTTLSVQVRRKAYHADQVSGNVIFNNTLTTEGTSGGGGTTPPPSGDTDGGSLPRVMVTYNGMDADTGAAFAGLYLSYGSIRVRTQTRGDRNSNKDSDYEYTLFTFDSNSPIQLDQYEANIGILSVSEPGFGTNYNHATGSGWLRMTSTAAVLLWAQEATAGGGFSVVSNLRIRVRRRSDQVIVMNKTVQIETTSIN